MFTVDEIKKLYDIAKEVIPAILEWIKSHDDRTSWESYDDLYEIEGFKVPYISVINNWSSQVKSYTPQNVSVKEIGEKFNLPEELMDTHVPSSAFNGKKCRLAHFVILLPESLAFTFQETDYFDYLKSGEYLDFPYPGNRKLTNRDAFGKVVREHKGHIWAFENLTNICGVGIFILTSDNYLILSKHSEKSHVYPGRHTYASSGTMDWENNLCPFEQVSIKCFNELGHRINRDSTKLIGFGADARKLYFQFSFLEKSEYDSSYFLDRVGTNMRQENHEILLLEFDEEKIADILVNKCWEPAAEATLLTIGALEGNKRNLKKSLFSKKSQWVRRSMRDEWDYRASKSGLLPVMSVRYPQNKLSLISSEYINSILGFIGEDLYGKTVVEVGSGIGRVTGALADKAKSVTCVELCGRMISLSLSRLGELENVSYVQSFGQDYRPIEIYDLAVASLVLIHNVDESEYERLVENLCTIGKEVYLFEDISKARSTSKSTRVRTKSELCKTFNTFGYSVAKESLFNLEGDEIVFLKFEKSEKSRS